MPPQRKRPKVVQERITPELAAEMLERNTHNRNLRPGRVKQLADAIRRGEWELNGQTLKFSADEVLIDGQHRLQAVVESGVPIETLVIRGLPPEVQDTVDTGRKRRLADILKIEGYHDTYVLAAVVNILHRYRNEMPIDYSQANAPTSRQAVQLIKAERNIEESVRAARRVNKSIGGPIGIFGAFHCVFHAIDPEPTEEFFARLGDGAELRKGDPLLHFRNQLIRPRKDRGYMQSPATVAGLMVKAFNLRREKRRINLLTFRKNEKLPEVNPPVAAKSRKGA